MKDTAFNKKNGLTIIGIVVICMVIGSFADYQISQTVFNIDSWFGKIFASYGQLPMSAGMVVGATLMIMVTEKRFKISTVLSYVGGAVLIFFGTFMACMEPNMYMPELPKAVLVIITLVIVFGLDFFAVKLVKGAERQDIKRFVKFLFFVTVIQMLLINIIKVPWARPRMRMIAVTEGAAFQPWWVIGSNMKETLTAIGVAAEEFKSFPSGHTGCAASLIYIALLPTVCTKLKGKENRLFWGAVVFAGIVAFSRIIMGAHFLTDVTVGFAVTCLVAYIGNAIIYRKHGKQ